MVADFCRDKDNCALENKPARDTVCFGPITIWPLWRRKTIPTSHWRSSTIEIRLLGRSVPYDRIVVYRKIADLYKQAGEVSAWLDTVKKLSKTRKTLPKLPP